MIYKKPDYLEGIAKPVANVLLRRFVVLSNRRLIFGLIDGLGNYFAPLIYFNGAS
jgi:hypothetical protein